VAAPTTFKEERLARGAVRTDWRGDGESIRHQRVKLVAAAAIASAFVAIGAVAAVAVGSTADTDLHGRTDVCRTNRHDDDATANGGDDIGYPGCESDSSQGLLTPGIARRSPAELLPSYPVILLSAPTLSTAAMSVGASARAA
jgi:hypothetical protein